MPRNNANVLAVSMYEQRQQHLAAGAATVTAERGEEANQNASQLLRLRLFSYGGVMYGFWQA
jgi:hypothetical protein